MPGAGHPATIRRARGPRAFAEPCAWRPSASSSGQVGESFGVVEATFPVAGVRPPAGEGPSPRSAARTSTNRAPTRSSFSRSSSSQRAIASSISSAGKFLVRSFSSELASKVIAPRQQVEGGLIGGSIS